MNNWEELSALADDQLDASAAAEMRRQMEANPNLQNQYDSLLSLKRSLRNSLPDHDSPETLSLCLDRIREIDRVGRTENVVHKFRYAIASGLATLIIGAAIVNNYWPDADVMGRSAIARSLSAGLAGGSEPIRAEGPASSWLRAQLESAPTDGLRMVQADQLQIDGRPVGRYFLTDGEADYVYLITPGVADCEGVPVEGYEGVKQAQIGDDNVLSWCENNMSFVFVSKQPHSRMLEFLRKR